MSTIPQAFQMYLWFSRLMSRSNEYFNLLPFMFIYPIPLYAILWHIITHSRTGINWPVQVNSWTPLASNSIRYTTSIQYEKNDNNNNHTRELYPCLCGRQKAKSRFPERCGVCVLRVSSEANSRARLIEFLTAAAHVFLSPQAADHSPFLANGHPVSEPRVSEPPAWTVAAEGLDKQTRSHQLDCYTVSKIWALTVCGAWDAKLKLAGVNIKITAMGWSKYYNKFWVSYIEGSLGIPIIYQKTISLSSCTALMAGIACH